MRTLALLLVLCASAWAAPPVVDIPAEIKATSEYVTVIPKTDAAAITYVAQSGVEPFPSVMLKDPRTFVLPTRGLASGRYKFVAVASLNDEHTRIDFSVLVGDAPVPPTPPTPPVPPKPDPPKPEPPKPSDKLGVVIIWESTESTPAIQRMITNLRAGSAAKYLKDKGHMLSIYDDDSVDQNGQAAAALESWRPFFRGMKLPAMFILDSPAGKALIHKQEIPAGATADNIVETIRQYGG